jgi:maleate cis-trans isomerase
MTGWRARIGVLFPGNAIVDDELWQLVPDGVSVHVNRLRHLEPDLGKPMSTANQATMRDALRLSGVATSGLFGRGSLYRRGERTAAGTEAHR